MGKTSKKKMTAVALATAAVLVLAGTMAYLADVSGLLKNQWDPNHVEVDIAETGIEKDAGKKYYTITPGKADAKDPKITVDTDTDAYVFAIVTDNINHSVAGKEYVDYDIADGWIELDTSDLTSKTVQKYLKTFENHKTTGELTINPKAANTKVYYRVVHGTNTDHSFGPYSVLKDDQIRYSSTLTNADLEKLADLTDEQKQLIFSTYAIQMDPFCDPAEIDADKIEAGAKDAWNQVDKVEKITVTQADGKTEVKVGEELPLTATVEPETAKDKTVTWTSSDTDIATVDENGVVTGVAAGTVTITATANDGSGVKGTYEVTVTGPSVSYAVEAIKIDNDGIEFGFAKSDVRNGSVSCENEHCIHRDSWAEIKAHPENYEGCVTNHCTKGIELDTSNKDIFVEDVDNYKTSGDGVSTLALELKEDARRFDDGAEGVDIVEEVNGVRGYGRADILETLDALFEAFPADLKAAITPVNIEYKTGYDLGQTYTGTLENAKLYLPDFYFYRDAGRQYTPIQAYSDNRLIWTYKTGMNSNYRPYGYANELGRWQDWPSLSGMVTATYDGVSPCFRINK